MEEKIISELDKSIQLTIHDIRGELNVIIPLLQRLVGQLNECRQSDPWTACSLLGSIHADCDAYHISISKKLEAIDAFSYAKRIVTRLKKNMEEDVR